LAQAINTAGSTEGAKMRDALADVKNYPGVTGNITIDEKRNATKSAVVLQVKANHANYVATVPPSLLSSRRSRGSFRIRPEDGWSRVPPAEWTISDSSATLRSE